MPSTTLSAKVGWERSSSRQTTTFRENTSLRSWRWFHFCVIDWLMDWLIDWLIEWLLACLLACLISWFVGWLIDLIDWLVCWLINWSFIHLSLSSVDELLGIRSQKSILQDSVWLLDLDSWAHLPPFICRGPISQGFRWFQGKFKWSPVSGKLTLV